MVGLILEARPLSGGVLIIVRGEVDATNAHQFETYIMDNCHPGDHVLLDLGAMPFMDCAGLMVLLRLHDYTQRHDAQLHLASVQRTPMRLLELTCVHWALAIHRQVEQAIAAVAGSRDQLPSDHDGPEPDLQSGVS